MTGKCKTAVAILVGGLLAAACHTEMLYQVQRHPLPQSLQQKLGENDEAKLIADAALASGWKSMPIKPGQIRAILNISDKHSATADILYDLQSFSIMLVSSDNLKQDDQGHIHREYNRAVHRLENTIDSFLMRAAY